MRSPIKTTGFGEQEEEEAFLRPAIKFASAWSLFRFPFPVCPHQKGGRNEERERDRQKGRLQSFRGDDPRAQAALEREEKKKEKKKERKKKERKERKKKERTKGKKNLKTHQHGVPSGSPLSAVAAAPAIASPTRYLCLLRPSPELGT